MYLKFKLKTESKTVDKWKVDLCQFWDKTSLINTVIYKKGPKLTVP